MYREAIASIASCSIGIQNGIAITVYNMYREAIASIAVSLPDKRTLSIQAVGCQANSGRVSENFQFPGNIALMKRDPKLLENLRRSREENEFHECRMR